MRKKTQTLWKNAPPPPAFRSYSTLPSELITKQAASWKRRYRFVARFSIPTTFAVSLNKGLGNAFDFFDVELACDWQTKAQGVQDGGHGGRAFSFCHHWEILLTSPTKAICFNVILLTFLFRLSLCLSS